MIKATRIAIPILAGGVLSLFIMLGTAGTLTLVIAVFLIGSFFHPLFWSTGWLIGEIFLGDFQIFGANIRTFIAISLGLYYLINDFVVHKGANSRLVVPFVKIPLALLVLGIVLNIYSNIPYIDMLRWIGTFSSNILTVFLLGIAINKEKHLKQIIYIFILILTINATIGILQYVGIGEMYVLREYLAKVKISGQEGRSLGLSRDVIEFAYQIQLSFCIIFGMSFLLKERIVLRRILLVCTLFINIVALGFCATRSAIGGIVLSGFICFVFGRRILGFNFKSNILSFVLLFVFVLCIGGLYKFNVNNSTVTNNTVKILTLKDSSALGRWPRMKLAFTVFINNPMGIGTEDYGKYILPSYWTRVGSDSDMTTEEYSPHNHYLKVFLHFGILGGLLFIVFMFKLFKLSFRLYKIVQIDLLKGFLIGGILFFMAYPVNIFFHNYGPLMGDNLFWFFLGLLAAITKLHSIKYIESNKCLNMQCLLLCK
jgi:O-antigen ligase